MNFFILHQMHLLLFLLSELRHYILQYKFTIEFLKGAKYFNPIRQVNKTLNIACSGDKWFLPLKDCSSVTLQPQMSMLFSFFNAFKHKAARGSTLLLVTLSVLWEFLKFISHGNMIHIKQIPASVQRKCLGTKIMPLDPGVSVVMSCLLRQHFAGVSDLHRAAPIT